MRTRFKPDLRGYAFPPNRDRTRKLLAIHVIQFSIIFISPLASLFPAGEIILA